MDQVTKESLKSLRKRIDDNLAMKIMAEYIQPLAFLSIESPLQIKKNRCDGIAPVSALPLSEQGRALRAFMFQGIRK